MPNAGVLHDSSLAKGYTLTSKNGLRSLADRYPRNDAQNRFEVNAAGVARLQQSVGWTHRSPKTPDGSSIRHRRPNWHALRHHRLCPVLDNFAAMPHRSEPSIDLLNHVTAAVAELPLHRSRRNRRTVVESL